MPFTLIQGTFQVVNYSPDGDSIRFHPNDPALIRGLLNGDSARLNMRGDVQLRIEAIDTLETHFTPPSGGSPSLHQPVDLARAATDRLLEFVGITGVVWDQQRRNVLSANDGTLGYILARSIERNGRAVAFVYSGNANEPDGSDVFLDLARLHASYNFTAISSGLAYATFYKGLFSDLRNELAGAAGTARDERKGVYATDGSQAGFNATNLGVITDEVPIFPKLFRRLSDYMVSSGGAVGFKTTLAAAMEPVLDLTTSNFTHFDTVIEQEDPSTQIRLTRFPEQLVFDETIPQPGPVFAAVMEAMR
jgi:endonuclease YncB( thermonuclease family)